MTDWIFLIIGILIWLEFLVGVLYCVGKNASHVSTFVSRPLGIPMPSMIIGLIVRMLLVAAGSVGIVRFFI